MALLRGTERFALWFLREHLVGGLVIQCACALFPLPCRFVGMRFFGDSFVEFVSNWWAAHLFVVE